jgi:hypothetical protein
MEEVAAKTGAQLISMLIGQHPLPIALLILAMLISPATVAIVVVLSWRKSDARQQALMEIYRADTQKVLSSYGEHVAQLARYYENNVDLVKSWQKIADGFQSVVVLNTQTITELCVLVKTRQDCPQRRKKA